VEVALAGASKITIVNRTVERGEELTKLLDEKLPVQADFVPWDSVYAAPEGTDVLINATSIGLFPDVDARLDLDVDSLREGMVVADVIPNPPATNLVKDARAKGCKVIDGLGMLVNQGVIGIRHWTGVDPDPSVMRKALEDIFG
jgi:shikimate dehydrogenase